MVLQQDDNHLRNHVSGSRWLFNGWMHGGSPFVELGTQILDHVAMLFGEVFLFPDIFLEVVELPGGCCCVRSDLFVHAHEFPVSLADGGVVDFGSGYTIATLLSRKPTAVLPAKPFVRLGGILYGDEGE